MQRNFVDTQDFTKEELIDIKDLGIAINKYINRKWFLVNAKK